MIEADVYEKWEAKTKCRYSGFVSTMKKHKDDANGKPAYLTEEQWKGWEVYWSSESFKVKSEKARKCRMSEPEGPGTGIVKHRGGSKSQLQRADELAVEMNTVRTNCAWPSYAGSRMKADGTYTDKKSERIGEVLARAALARRPLPGTTEPRQVNMTAIFLNVIGGGSDRKKRMFGLGNLAQAFVAENTSSQTATIYTKLQERNIAHPVGRVSEEL